MIFDRSRASNLIGTPFAVLVCWVLWGAIDHRLLLGWLGMQAGVTSLRTYSACPGSVSRSGGWP